MTIGHEIGDQALDRTDAEALAAVVRMSQHADIPAAAKVVVGKRAGVANQRAAR